MVEPDWRELAEQLPQIVWAADPNGRLYWINGRWRELTGMSHEEGLDERSFAAVHPDDLDGVLRGWQAGIDAGRPIELEYRLRARSGAYRWHLARMVPAFDLSGTIVHWTGTALDIQDRREAEAALREAARRKDEFLALLSHELRNPLSPIITAAQLMDLRGDPASAHEREVILRQARHLLRLVDDLLDVSRISSGKVALKRKYMGLATAINSAIEATRPLFETLQHRLTLAIAPRGLAVDGDETRLIQVISNLLTNAARYTPPGGEIEVSAARSGNEVVLRVRDNGPGIPDELRPHIFEMFVQGEQGPDRAQGGLGLGLFLVRLLTELHGGTVEVASVGPGPGCELTVRLPAATVRPDDAPVRAPAGIRPSANARVERVLIVDDNQDGARAIAKLLQRGGHAVRVAFDPPAALALAAEFKPQVAILDIGLPVMDGYELARELRARLAEAPPILIALTGYGQDGDRRRSDEAGFAAHLVKPVYFEALAELLATL